MNKEQQHEPGDVFQITPSYSQAGWVGAFFVASEIKPWGVQGYVHMIIDVEAPGSQAYNRIKWEHLQYIGKAKLIAE